MKKILLPLIAASFLQTACSIPEIKMDQDVVEVVEVSQKLADASEFSNYGTENGSVLFHAYLPKGMVPNNKNVLTTMIEKNDSKKSYTEVLVIQDFQLDNLTDYDTIRYTVEKNGKEIKSKTYKFKDLPEELQISLKQEYTKIIQESPTKLKQTYSYLFEEEKEDYNPQRHINSEDIDEFL